GRVLARHVDEAGRIDFAGLAKAPADLETYVTWVWVVSPASNPREFPTRESVLAYYLNAYNALAMYNVLQSGIPPELESIKVRFFYRNRLPMGGKRISLYDLENRLVRPIGDPRVHFALNCMVRSCPRLPREPFVAERLDAQLDAAAREFLNDKRNVDLLPGSRTARVSMILNWYEKDFLIKAPNLAAYIARYRAARIPARYEIEFIPYDWTLNRQ
ncbi:MAG: DUF547 domain-containing protein, partial [Thermoanaerobaculia bacterium]